MWPRGTPAGLMEALSVHARPHVPGEENRNACYDDPRSVVLQLLVYPVDRVDVQIWEESSPPLVAHSSGWPCPWRLGPRALGLRCRDAVEAAFRVVLGAAHDKGGAQRRADSATKLGCVLGDLAQRAAHQVAVPARLQPLAGARRGEEVINASLEPTAAEGGAERHQVAL